MNNIEIKDLGIKAGMTSNQINKLKNKKRNNLLKKDIPKKDIPKVKTEKLPSARILNLKKDEYDERDFKLSSIAYGLPTKKDYTSQMSSVKDQKSLGSCVGFAVTAMKEWQEQQEHLREVKKGKKYKREEDHYDLSEAWVYWKCKEIDPWPNQEGTSIRCAMQVLNKIGIPCENAYSYSDKYKGEPKSWAKLIAKWGLIKSYYRCSDLNALKTALANNGPVVIGIACFREIFYVGDNGNVPYPKNPNELLGGHAICAVGYDDNTQKIKFKNSWGTKWGQNGYGYISYSYIRDFMWDSWVARDLRVDTKILRERAKDELI